MTDDRAEFEKARQVGLERRHEARLENATYTAAEVKVLTEVALRLGRKEALGLAVEAIEDYQLALEAAFEARGHEADELRADAAENCATIVRDIASQPIPDATSGRTEASGYTEAGSELQAGSKRYPGDAT